MSKSKQPWEPFWLEEEEVWGVDFSVEGKRFRRRIGIRDRSLRELARQKAKALHREAWDAALNPDATESGTPFFKAARTYVEAGGEARFVTKLIKHFGPDTMIDDIDEEAIVAAEIGLYGDASPDTRRRQARVPIKAILNHARGRTRKKSTDNRRVRWLTPEEVERMLDAASRPEEIGLRDPNLTTLSKIAFMIGTGAGPGETFAVNVADFNHATNQCLIVGEEVGAGKTNARGRWLRIPDRAMTLIGDLPDDGRAFRAPNGEEYVLRKNGGGQMKEAFDKVRKAARLGPDVIPYVLHHTWATWFFAQTRDFGTLMDLGGWGKADTANRYRKLAPDDLSERLLAHGWDFRPKAVDPARFGEKVVVLPRA